MRWYIQLAIEWHSFKEDTVCGSELRRVVCWNSRPLGYSVLINCTDPSFRMLTTLTPQLHLPVNESKHRFRLQNDCITRSIIIGNTRESVPINCSRLALVRNWAKLVFNEHQVLSIGRRYAAMCILWIPDTLLHRIEIPWLLEVSPGAW